MSNLTAEVLKIERERIAVRNSLCSPFLKTKMLAELDAKLHAIEAREAGDPAVQAGSAPAGRESRGVKGSGTPQL